MLLFIDFELAFCIQSMIWCSDCYFLLHVELGFNLEVEWNRGFQLNWVPVCDDFSIFLSSESSA